MTSIINVVVPLAAPVSFAFLQIFRELNAFQSVYANIFTTLDAQLCVDKLLLTTYLTDLKEYSTL